MVLPFCSATPVNVRAFTVKWNQLTTSYEPTLGDSVAANSRLAQPHRARLCGNRSETRVEHFANSDPEIAPSDLRLEIATFERVRDSQSAYA